MSTLLHTYVVRDSINLCFTILLFKKLKKKQRPCDKVKVIKITVKKKPYDA